MDQPLSRLAASMTCQSQAQRNALHSTTIASHIVAPMVADDSPAAAIPTWQERGIAAGWANHNMVYIDQEIAALRAALSSQPVTYQPTKIEREKALFLDWYGTRTKPATAETLATDALANEVWMARAALDVCPQPLTLQRYTATGRTTRRKSDVGEYVLFADLQEKMREQGSTCGPARGLAGHFIKVRYGYDGVRHCEVPAIVPGSYPLYYGAPMSSKAKA